MKVLLIIPGLPINHLEIKGGIYSATINLLNGFSNFDHEFVVLVFNRNIKKIVEYNYSKNILFKYYPEGTFIYHSLNYLLRSSYIVKKEFLKFKPDIIHYELGNTFLFTSLLLPKKAIIIQTIHGFSFKELKNKRLIIDKCKWFLNGFIQYVLEPKNIIHLSLFSKSLYRSISQKNNLIIPNAVSDIFFNVSIDEYKSNNLIYIGVIDENKNLLFVLNILTNLIKENKQYHLHIVGDFIDPFYKNLVLEFISKNHLESFVIFYGWIDQLKLIEVLKVTEFLIVASKHESLPMAIAECMAAGKIILASDVGGIPEMINNYNNGFLFNLKEPDELFHLLRMLHKNSFLKNEIKINAKNYAYKNYNKNEVSSKTIDFYNKIKNDGFVYSDKVSVAFKKKFYFFYITNNCFIIKKEIINLFSFKTYQYINENLNFFKSFCIRYKSQSLQIELNNNIKHIFNDFSSNIKNEISRSNKYNYQFIYNNNLNDFYPLYLKFVEKKKIYKLKKSLLENISNHLIFSFIYFENKLLVSHCYIIDKKNSMVRLLLSASDRFDENEKKFIGLSNKRLIYEDLQYFKSRNLKIFDFGGIDTLSKNPQIIGINRFKMSFTKNIVIQYNYDTLPYFILRKISSVLDRRFS